MRYLLIGNSAAAIGCVEGIRQVDRTGEILLVSDEPYHTYSRPLISYLLLGETDEERMKYRPDDFYKENNCTCLFGKKAVRLDPAAKTVRLEDGDTLSYDKLLVATGSAPFVPPMDGLDTVEKKFTFMTLDSAKALREALSPDARVLIVGAGLIGLKCAEGIRDLAGQITVVDLADRILSSILDEAGAAVMQKHLEQNGIQFILSDSIKKFSGNCAEFHSGKTLEYDILVLAVGVRPNLSLVKDAGGEVGRGIVVDECSRTSLADVYAAGDCTQSHDISSGDSRIMALLPNAYMQGEAAGVNMAGGERAFDRAIPMNAIGFYGLHIVTAGSYIGEAVEIPHKNGYKKLFVQDDLLKGYIIIGDVDRAGIYTSLIRDKTPLSSIDADSIFHTPGLMAFGGAARAHMLAGE